MDIKFSACGIKLKILSPVRKIFLVSKVHTAKHTMTNSSSSEISIEKCLCQCHVTFCFPASDSPDHGTIRINGRGPEGRTLLPVPGIKCLCCNLPAGAQFMLKVEKKALIGDPCTRQSCRKGCKIY